MTKLPQVWTPYSQFSAHIYSFYFCFSSSYFFSWFPLLSKTMTDQIEIQEWETSYKGCLFILT